MLSRRQLEKFNGKQYKALLSQAGTANPTASILNNSLGKAPVWARTGAGTFTLTLAGAFPAGKVAIKGNVYDQATGKMLSGVRTSDNVLTFTHGIAAGAASDVFSNVLVHVEVYS